MTAVIREKNIQVLAVSIPYGAVGSRTPTVMTPGDYDGDGKDDITIYRSATGEWLTRRSSNGALLSRSWERSHLDQPVPADYDGDGRGRSRDLPRDERHLADSPLRQRRS